MIETKLTLPVDPQKRYLLNKPFESYYFETNGRISSYHDPKEFKAEWLSYYNPLNNIEVVIAYTPERLPIDKYLTYIGSKNGTVLSRNNLFMLWELYEDELKKFINQGEPIRISAIAAPELLPEHNGGLKICPTLEIIKKDFDEYKLNYDWSWIEHPNTPIHYFVFFKHSMHKPY